MAHDDTQRDDARRGDARLLLLDKHQVDQLLQPQQLLAAVREAFMLHSQREGRVFPVVREALPTGGIFGIKSGDVPTQGLLGFKAAGFWPANRALNGEPHQATILLIDPATGRPLCVIDGNTITAMRTGGAGAWGLTTLARPDSARLCVFGTGVQAAIQVRFALAHLPSIREVVYLTHDGAPRPAFEAQVAAGLTVSPTADSVGSAGSAAHADTAARCSVTHARDANQAVARSDIVITATPGAAPLFDAHAVQPGTHLNCVGADTRGKRELPDGLLSRVRLFVDDREQARQIGETQWAPDTGCTELGDLLTGAAAFARQPDDITVFDMTGLALQDLTVARLLHRQACETGTGSSIAWPW
ncbi:MAG: ornithine cyclodeaminase family protein [Janthinobacterium lividum]